MFKTVEEASQRWITEGKAYKDKLNNWLDIIYIDKKQPETSCPEETRKDMAPYVLDQIIAFNEQGKQEELRRLFPPDNDPMDWNGIAACVSQATILPDNRLIVTVGEWHQEQYMYIINGNDYVMLDNIFMFGKSADKKYFAKAYPDKIEITEGWDGPVIKTLAPPKSYGEKYATVKDGLADLSLTDFGIHQLVVFPSGQRIAMATAVGIFIIDDSGSTLIETENKEAEEEGYTFRHDYPHIDVSPDEKYIIVGSQSSSHLLLEEIDGVWTTVATVEPRSSYPNLAKFNYKVKDKGGVNDGPQVLLCSCHFGGSASLSLPIKNVTPGFEASGYDADDTLNYVDTRKWVFSAANYTWGYALGTNDGYIWFKGIDGAQHGYLYVGGTVMDMEFDQKKLVVASYSGQVIIYDCDPLFPDNQIFRSVDNKAEKRPDHYSITNTAYKDVKRYLFFKGQHPKIW
ncbi:hypothetical protein [Chitinophaga ginsengisoli]|nr:hypothetical protein [Chitinophaga ginsengisoli]